MCNSCSRADHDQRGIWGAHSTNQTVFIWNFTLDIPNAGQLGWKAGKENEYFFWYSGSSSAIGMLFDHGSDCLSSFMIGVSVLKILAVTEKSIIVFIIITHVLSVFFTAMWNQFHTFNFELGMINPVDDGIPTVALLAIGNCFIDHSVWNSNFAVRTVNVDFLLFLLAPLICKFGIIQCYCTISTRTYSSSQSTRLRRP